MTYSYTQISQYLTCPRRYRHRYLDGWKEKDTRAAMLFGRAFERALGALFRREDPGAVLFAEWSRVPGRSSALFQPRLLGSHASARNPALDPLLPRRSRADQPASTKSASQVQSSHGRQQRLRRLYRCYRKTRWQAVPDGVEDQLQPIPGRTRGLAVSGPATRLLFVDNGYCGSRAGRFRPQEPGRGSIPAHHDNATNSARSLAGWWKARSAESSRRTFCRTVASAFPRIPAAAVRMWGFVLESRKWLTPLSCGVQEPRVLIGLTSLVTEYPPMPPKFNRRRALFVLGEN